MKSGAAESEIVRPLLGCSLSEHESADDNTMAISPAISKKKSLPFILTIEFLISRAFPPG
jgi:hypothetical protein